jgi:hypothetical protein
MEKELTAASQVLMPICAMRWHGSMPHQVLLTAAVSIALVRPGERVAASAVD